MLETLFIINDLTDHLAEQTFLYLSCLFELQVHGLYQMSGNYQISAQEREARFPQFVAQL